METQNIAPKSLEVLGANQVSSVSMKEQQTPVALSEMGNNAMITEADRQRQEAQRILDKYVNDELTYEDLNQVLSTTIIEDEHVKIPILLVELLTLTDSSQKNVTLTGGSSFGKTHSITQTLWYFRDLKAHSILEINDATPRSLIYSPNAILVDERTLEPIDLSKAPQKGDDVTVWNEWNEKRKHFAHFLDLSKYIVVFYDMKNFDLLQNLRSILSHDPTEDDCRIYTYLTTDRTSSGSHKTKKILMKGYFTAIFASACSEIDEQEFSRNYLLSPSDNPEKIKKAIEMQTRELTDPKFKNWYENDPMRLGLKQRVQLIEEAQIKKVLFKAEDMENLKDWFFKNIDNLAPKAQRDFPRMHALAQAWSLLNFNHRERTPDNTCIYANSTDIEAAKKVYEPILKCNGLGLTPEEYGVWKIMQKTFDENLTYASTGLRIQEIHNVYFYEKKRRCSDKRLRRMLKNFVSAGLLREEKDGVIYKYYPIEETIQSEQVLCTQSLEKVATGEETLNNSLFQRQGAPTTDVQRMDGC